MSEKQTKPLGAMTIVLIVALYGLVVGTVLGLTANHAPAWLGGVVGGGTSGLLAALLARRGRGTQ